MKSFYEWSEGFADGGDYEYEGFDKPSGWSPRYKSMWGVSHKDIKTDPQEREAQKRELADIIDKGERAEKFLAYINSVEQEHMSRSGLEF